MKCFYFLLLTLVFIINCERNRFSSQDFEGNTFTASILPNKPASSSTVIISGVSGVVYTFGKNGKAILRGTSGITTTEYSVKWQIKNDSLILASFNRGGSISIKRWLIQKTQAGFLINDGQTKLELLRIGE
ncbi:hypothetical protein [Spirosoma aerophilum]